MPSSHHPANSPSTASSLRVVVKSCCFRLLAEMVAPVVAFWISRHQRRISEHGRLLTNEELAFANSLGVAGAHQVCVMAVDAVPLPLPTFFIRLAERFSWGCPDPAGMAVGNGIYAVRAWESAPALIRHELVHLLQYQRMGGPWHFLREYLWQCLFYGYEQAPLEIEARTLGG